MKKIRKILYELNSNIKERKLLEEKVLKSRKLLLISKTTYNNKQKVKILNETIKMTEKELENINNKINKNTLYIEKIINNKGVVKSLFKTINIHLYELYNEIAKYDCLSDIFLNKSDKKDNSYVFSKYVLKKDMVTIVNIDDEEKLDKTLNNILYETTKCFEYHIALKSIGTTTTINNIYDLYQNQRNIENEILRTNINLKKIVGEVQSRLMYFMSLGVSNYNDYESKLQKNLFDENVYYIPRLYLWINSIDNLILFNESEYDEFRFEEIKKNLEKLALSNSVGIHLIIINSSNSPLLKGVTNRNVIDDIWDFEDKLILLDDVNKDYVLNNNDGIYTSNIKIGDIKIMECDF